MNTPPPFYNKLEEKQVTKGHMPHWSQRQKLYAVTFRLNDSLPEWVIKAYINECKSAFGEEEPHFKEKRELMMHKKMMQYMDAGHGDCILKEKSIREIIEREFEYIDQHMAYIHAYVIMPNHVHAIVETKGEYTITKVIYTLKRHTAININKTRGRSGSIWQREYFDRIIRSYDHYHHAINYILNNPSHCRQGEYTLWQRSYS